MAGRRIVFAKNTEGEDLSRKSFTTLKRPPIYSIVSSKPRNSAQGADECLVCASTIKHGLIEVTSMHKCLSPFVVAVLFVFTSSSGRGLDPPARPSTFRLTSLQGLEVVNGTAALTTYRGHRAVHLEPLADHRGPGDAVLAILTGPDFKDGTIEVEVAGSRRADSGLDERGFIGLAFRVQPHASSYENIYLRPVNGRAEDQLQRNHSVQYTSHPDFPWRRLRDENPGQYESYVDLEPGVWTRLKIVVSGTRASLYVNEAPQPCLVVTDLKLGDTHGQIALWAHWSTDGYFSNLTIR